jgi:hypothetical protein
MAASFFQFRRKIFPSAKMESYIRKHNQSSACDNLIMVMASNPSNIIYQLETRHRFHLYSRGDAYPKTQFREDHIIILPTIIITPRPFSYHFKA